ncbi:MAG: glycosyl transferase family 1, partial [Nitrospinota bacterium]
MKKMKVLFLAPHPFFQERGTPIDDLLILRVLATRDDVEVDMVSYHEGTDIEIPGVTFFRTRHLPFIKNIRPGFSMKKLVCDVFLFFKAGQLIRKKRYDLIHAVEEAGFIALFFRLLNGTQYIFDMDSSISQQLVESRPFLKIFSPFFDWMEGLLIRNSIVNFPVCNALADFCKTHGSKKTVTVHDISQLPNPGAPRTGRLKKELKIQGLLILYAGN